jgi:hypothetical protein
MSLIFLYVNTFLFKIKKEDKKHSSRKKLLTIKEKKKINNNINVTIINDKKLKSRMIINKIYI